MLTEWESKGKTHVRVSADHFSTALPGYRSKKCLHGGQDIFHDDIDTLSRRVQAVRLVEASFGGDALQKKRIECHSKGFCQLRVDRVETRRIVTSIIWRRNHPAQEDRDLARRQPRQNVRQRGAGDSGIDAPQGILGAESNDA